MHDPDARTNHLETRFDGLTTEVGHLRNDLGELRGEMRQLGDDLRGEMRQLGDELRGQIGEVRDGLQAQGQQLDRLQSEMGVVRSDLRGLARVVDRHSHQLDTHGRLLAEIKEQLAPMKDIKDFMQRVADEHERRITDLERHTGLHPQTPSRQT